MGIEGLHTETGAGVLEAALRVSDGLDAADKAALFKTFTKVLAQRRDWLATFMAKWSKDWPGCGGHIHMSLWKDGKPVVLRRERAASHEPDDAPLRRRPAGADAGAARHGRPDDQFLPPADPGLLGADRRDLGRREPHLRAAGDPRLGEVARASNTASAAADANPYLALAAALGSGLWGIEHKLDPGEPVKGNAYDEEASGELAAAAHADGGGRPAQGLEGGARRCSATPSSIITPQRANGKSASSASTSPTGNSTATSRSSDERSFVYLRMGSG